MTWRHAKAAVAGVIVLYVGSYALNSAAGGYWPLLDMATAAGMDEPDEVLWQPRYGYHCGRWSDALGAVYSPLIRLDWKLVHKPRRIFGERLESWLFESAPLEDFHSDAREYLRLTRVLKKKLEALQAGEAKSDPAAAKRVRAAFEAEPEFAAMNRDAERLLIRSGWR